MLSSTSGFMLICMFISSKMHEFCRFMKKQLQDTSKLLRKRKNLPLTALDAWKSCKKLRMEQLFVDPTMTGAFHLWAMQFFSFSCFLASQIGVLRRWLVFAGFCDDLHEVMKKGFYRVNPNLTEALLESRDADSPSGTAAFEMEIEHPRFKENHGDGALPEFIPFPSGEELIPLFSGNLGSVVQTGKSLESEFLLTPELRPSELDDAKSETALLYDQPLHTGDNVLPDLLHSPEAEVSYVEFNVV